MTAIHPLWSFCVGDTFPIAGVCNDAAGNILDLSGALLVEWKLEPAPPRDCDDDDDDEASTPVAPTVALDLTVGSGIAITNAPLGEVEITVTAAQSAMLLPGRYRDQLRVITADGTTTTQWVGFIDVKPTF